VLLDETYIPGVSSRSDHPIVLRAVGWGVGRGVGRPVGESIGVGGGVGRGVGWGRSRQVTSGQFRSRQVTLNIQSRKIINHAKNLISITNVNDNVPISDNFGVVAALLLQTFVFDRYIVITVLDT
jgi:hypothetical protein